MNSAHVVVKGVSKRFPGVLALNNVSADFKPGECHALMGENGAGKSTLGKLMAGLYQPDTGSIELNGHPCHFGGPLDAQKVGIGIVHQELLFCENMSVAENLSIGNIPSKRGLASFTTMRKRAEEWLAMIGAKINPDTLVGNLPIAQKQLVQIAGAIGSGAKVLIFDEPTSSLGLAETHRLLEIIRQLKADGVACIYVSHRLEEVFEVCDRATVLRDGQFVGTVEIASTSKEELVAMMIGREVTFERSGCFQGDLKSDPLFQVEGFSSLGKFSNISFGVRPGEIVGLGGLIGSGRTEVLEALFGLDRDARGHVKVHGHPVDIHSPVDGLKQRMALSSEDRKRNGLVLSMNCMENISMPILDRLSSLGFINAPKERAVSQKYFDRMRVKAPRLTTASAALSGGNQQKLVLAKWLGTDGEVFLIDEPTRGVDVGAKAEIHNLIRELAQEGKAVVVVSSELPELIAVSHRILILRLGKIVGEISADQATEELLMKYMTGLAA